MYKKWEWSITVVCLVFGVLAGLQLKAQRNVPSAHLPSRRTEYLINRIYYLERENKNLKEEKWQLMQKLTDMSGSGGASSVELNRDVIMMAGLSPVRGPGVIIVLEEKKNGRDNSDLFLIHDYDLLTISNELFAAGAEAVSINGQRIVTHSYFICNGPTININNTKIAPPFEIRVIGDPKQLENSITMRGSYLDTLKNLKFDIKINRYDEIEIPAYLGALNLKYVTPVKEGN
ncbi:MAG: DUF881 domain-containing protein [Bacillota bacterium]